MLLNYSPAREKMRPQNLLWENVNLKEKWWHIPDPKNTNPVTFPLSDIAVNILEKPTPRPASMFSPLVMMQIPLYTALVTSGPYGRKGRRIGDAP